MPIPRQLAPTVGHKVPGVTFQAGTLGGVGKQIAVGRVTRYGGHSYVNSDESWLPADDYLIGCAIVPIGGINVFIGYTPEAYGLPRFYNPTHQPFDQAVDRQDGSESAFSQESAESDFHFVGVVGLGSDSQPENNDPESILPALQEDAMSDAGSRSTVQVNVDSDSDDDASLFEEKIKTRFSSGNPAPSEGTADTDMPDKLAMMVVVGHETTPVTSEAQNKPAEDAGDTTAGQLIESSDKVRAKKESWPRERRQQQAHGFALRHQRSRRDHEYSGE